MDRDYTIGEDSWDNLDLFGIALSEYLQVVQSPPRVVRHLEDVLLVYGVTDAGRYLVVILEEATDREEIWKVLAGREMTGAEVASFHRVREGK